MLKLEGIRAELAVVRTARCAAAWGNRASVEDRDLEEAWDLCLGYREPDRSNSRTPSSTPAAQSGKTSVAAVARTSSAPLDSRPNPVKLPPSQAMSHKDLQEWWQRPSHRHLAARDRSVPGGFSEKPRGPIAWLESVVFSSRMGWVPGRTAMHLQV